MAENLVVGSCGGQGGHEWSYVLKGDIHTDIYISYDEEAIYSIAFVFLNEYGKEERSEFGGEDGSKDEDELKNAKIELDDKIEKLNGITGTVGIFNGSQTVTSLRFTTDSNKTFGPFGSPRGASFSFYGGDDHIISGFHGRCGFWLDAIGVYLKPVEKLPKIRAGPWGSQEPGNSWEFEPNGSISDISITYDDCIYSIVFTSRDVNGNVEKSKKIGNTTGSKTGEVSIDINNEKLNKITGTYDKKNGYVVVTSLSFSTDKKNVFGPYGTTKGTSFSLEVNNEEFAGFFGRSGSWLDAIGVSLLPIKQIVVDQWGSQDPGNEWSYAPNGLISEISLTHEDAIYSIIFTSVDDKGNVEHSKKFGSKTGSKSDKIEIDIKNEKLNYISGTVGVKSGYTVVTSISFKTDKNKTFGPFGVANGTAFSLPVTNGYFSGFHGRAGYWLDAIGVYVHPA